MRLLAEIFNSQVPLGGSELRRRCDIPQQTVAREVARLEAAGLVVSYRVGTSKLVSPNPDLPYGRALRQLLAYAGGIVPLLQQGFAGTAGIEEVFIFGSWARRYQGEPGPPPNDVDVAVVSPSLTRFDLAEVRMEIEDVSGLSINLFVFEPGSEQLADLRDGAVAVVTEATT